MNKKENVINFEINPSIPKLRLNLDFNFIKHEFTQNLKWFEDEVDEILGSKTHNITEIDVKLAFAILDRLSETINKYRDKGLLLELLTTLDNIEKKFPEYF
ncbi:MAG: hypothetical protein KGD73_12085 [Candidatus Lokiarchaeota archaeon]|nr:hypothetical protein [Candidatus Lokiarchaeota archaeon]